MAVKKTTKKKAVEEKLEEKVEVTETQENTEATENNAGTEVEKTEEKVEAKPEATTTVKTYRGKAIIGEIEEEVRANGMKFLRFTVEGVNKETYLIPEKEAGDIKEA